MNPFFKNLIPQDKKSKYVWFGAIFLAFLIGTWLSGGTEITDAHPAAGTDIQAAQATVWTCSMHPQVRQPKPGKCPICGMDLIPVKNNDSSNSNSAQLILSENARKLAEVETVPVERKFVANEIRMLGKISYDETRLDYITARVPGRIDRLFVNYTGISVHKGDHMAEIYSPELLSTQQELLESVRNLNAMQNNSFAGMKETARRQVESVRERLRLWGLTERQIDNIIKRGKTSDHMTLYSPASGVVVKMDALEGTYVQTGTRIYAIADLLKVWVQLDAYEQDLPWLRYGETVEFHTEAYPDEIFKGRIAFIDPVVDSQTRSVKLRVNLDNKDGKLKPGMFVHGLVSSRLAANGKVIDPDLAGKWIGPMHPEIIKDHPGKCDVCGMPLVRAEDLGYAAADESLGDAPLVISASAPLITGKRAVVYVAVPGKDGIYEGREVQLGPRTGDYYIVKSGLKEGDQVVVKGNFKIDSAIQIQAGPSMMNPPADSMAVAQQPAKKQAGNAEAAAVPQAFKKQLDMLYASYFDVQYALSHDNLADARKKAGEVLQSLKKVNMELLQGDSHMQWMKSVKQIKASASGINGAADMDAARKAFDPLSQTMIAVGKTFGSGLEPLLVYHCPMAFNNRGADWLQNKKGTENPYFGSAMFTCGDLTADLTAAKKNAGGRGNE
ncbi:MAG: efflux RND transporter periplasmic adaptor subunit [Calditrichia bacterium]